MTDSVKREDAGITLARYAANLRYEDLPADVVAKVKELILDSFGVALAGSTAPGIDAAVKMIRQWGGNPEATLYGHGLKLPSSSVAMVNGAMSTARDFDDTLDDAMLHTQPSVLPGVLAMAEAEGGRNGRDIIAAVTAGAELISRMGHARRKGQEFLPTGTCGALGTAGAVARLLGLPFEGVLNACGVAYSQCAANVQPLRDGATVKRFHAGFAARNGVVAATLARNGLTGARHFLEGPYGYYNLYERGEYDPAPLTKDLGRYFHLKELALKPWPSARDNHGIVDAALELAAEHDLKAEQIASIDAYLPPNAFGVSGKPWAKADGHPVVEAIVSGAYCVAVAVIRRGLYLEDFTEERIADPAVGALARRVNVALFPGVTSEIAFVPQMLRVHLKSGRTIERRIDTMKGHPGKPMSRPEVIDKFRRCGKFAARPASAKQLDAIIHAVDNLEAMKDVRELGVLMAL